jgi:hypothetical protein
MSLGNLANLRAENRIQAHKQGEESQAVFLTRSQEYGTLRIAI